MNPEEYKTLYEPKARPVITRYFLRPTGAYNPENPFARLDGQHEQIADALYHIYNALSDDQTGSGRNFVFLSGSLSRRLLGGSENVDRVARTIRLHTSSVRQTAKKSHGETQKLYEDVADRLERGPFFDIDFMVLCAHPEEYLPHIAQQLDTHSVGNLRSISFGTHASAIHVEILLENSLPFTVDCLAYRNAMTIDQEQADFRFGPGQSSKQTIILPLATYDDCPQRQVLWYEYTQAIQERLKEKSSIPNPHYQTVEQALIAGLRTIFHEQMWPAEASQHTHPQKVTDRIDARTIDAYRNELEKLVRENAHIPPEDPLYLYRKGELIAQILLCLDADTADGVRMMSALGILDALWGITTTDQTYEQIADNLIKTMKNLLFNRLHFSPNESYLSWVDFIEAVEPQSIGKENEEKMKILLESIAK